jgi:phospholipid transport system substrate-binding protein
VAPSSFRAVTLALAALLFPLSAGAETPLETIRVSNDKVLAIYALHETVNAEAERAIYAVIDEVTDFDGIASSVTSRFCRKLTEEQCRLFGEVFVRLLRTSSTKKLGRYRADGFEYHGEEMEGEGAVVRTTAYFGEDNVSLDYYLDRRDGRWVIVNYVVDDVDTIRNYRKQFTRLFSKKSFERVIERLEERIASYEQE